MITFSPQFLLRYYIYLYLCIMFGEQTGLNDALAYYFALTEKTSEICFGIVRFKKAKEKRPNGRSFLSTNISYAPRFGVEHSYSLRGVPIPRSAP